MLEVLAESSLVALAVARPPRAGVAAGRRGLGVAGVPLGLRWSTVGWSLAAASASGLVAGGTRAARGAHRRRRRAPAGLSTDGAFARPARRWAAALAEPASLAVESIRTSRAIGARDLGIVIGIVTVVLVASVLAASATRWPSSSATSAPRTSSRSTSPATVLATLGGEARRRPLEPEYGRIIARLATRSARSAAGHRADRRQRPGARRARGSNESDSAFIEGSSPNLFDVTGAAFASGRPFTELEDRAGARVVVLGANVARPCSAGRRRADDRPRGDDQRRGLLVVGELAKRKGGFFGENRGDNVLALPAGTVARRFRRRRTRYSTCAPGQDGSRTPRSS